MSRTEVARGGGGVARGDHDGSGASVPSGRVAGESGDLGPAPEFTLQDLRGAMIESGYLSRPVTVVHFWATWCVPCMREIPQLNQFARVYEPRGAALYAIAVSSGTLGELRQIARTYDIRHRVLIGDEAVWRGFGPIESYPTTFIVDSRGRIVERYVGDTPDVRRRVEAAVQGLIAASDKAHGAHASP
jgi:thiol-disulfide isomerase/thioredoxin